MGLAGSVSTHGASPASASERTQTTVLHAERLYTRDLVRVSVVVALHWHLRDVQTAAAATIALTRTKVKDAALVTLGEVVSSTMLAALQVEHALIELRLRNGMTRPLAGLGVDIRSCRLHDITAPPDDGDRTR